MFLCVHVFIFILFVLVRCLLSLETPYLLFTPLEMITGLHTENLEKVRYRPSLLSPPHVVYGSELLYPDYTFCFNRFQVSCLMVSSLTTCLFLETSRHSSEENHTSS